MGAERKSQLIDAKNKLATAYHEVCLYAFVIIILSAFENDRADTLLLRCTPRELCHCTKLLASLEATRWVLYVYVWILSLVSKKNVPHRLLNFLRMTAPRLAIRSFWLILMSEWVAA
jgi:hypothetical protein